jgi:hypothetical protein
VERPLGGPVHAVVVVLVAVGETVDDDEIEDAVLPALLGLDLDRGRRCGLRGRPARGTPGSGAAGATGQQEESSESKGERSAAAPARPVRERLQRNLLSCIDVNVPFQKVRF